MGAAVLAFGLVVLGGNTARAAENYVPGSIYVGGAQTCLQGDLFAAKWWAGPQELPSDVDLVEQPWETPWERLEADAAVCTSDTSPEPVVPVGDAPEIPVDDSLADLPVDVVDDSAEDAPADPMPEDNVGWMPPTDPVSDSLPVSTDCPVWDGEAVYVGGAFVSHAGAEWEAQWWTRGDEPGTTGVWGVWRLAGDASVACAIDGSEDLGDAGSAEPGTIDPVVIDPVLETIPDAIPDATTPTAGSPVYLSELLATEEALTSGALMAEVKRSIQTLDNAAVEAVVAGRSANPENVQRVESIVDAADWDFFFPRRAPEYTYTNFLRAIAKFPAFCGTYNDGRDADAICRKALATMFAHFTQETGGHTIAWPEPQWRQGLVYVRELGWSEDAAGGYGICDPASWQGEAWPCSVFDGGHPREGQYKSYFGRGAKQLSYNYNYGPFSEAMFGDVTVLLEQPNLVADTWLNLASAVFFYVYPQPPKPSMLHALDGTWVPNAHDLAGGLEPGFGVTTQIINGGVECGGPTEHAQSRNRIEYYRNFARELEVPLAADEVLGCANMQRFDTQGSGALAINWEQDWTQAEACQLVSYQTPFSAFLDGDYARCVESFFEITIVDDLE